MTMIVVTTFLWIHSHKQALIDVDTAFIYDFALTALINVFTGSQTVPDTLQMRQIGPLQAWFHKRCIYDLMIQFFMDRS